MASISQEVIDCVNRYVQQIPEYRLVACSQCRYAIWPQESRRHFAGAKHNIPSKVVADISQVIQSWTQLIQSRIELSIPEFVEQALKVWAIGLSPRSYLGLANPNGTQPPAAKY